MAAPTRPVRQGRASADIVRQVEAGIAAGALSAGDRLRPEREMAEDFGVSRITVRDALRVLEGRGLVHIKLGSTGGAFIAESNVRHVVDSISTLIRLQRMTLADLAEARTVVETAATELAAAHATPDGLAEIQRSIDDGLATKPGTAAHRTASLGFHLAVAACSGNQVLRATVGAYGELLDAALHDFYETHSGESERAHERIAAAIRRGNGPLAGKLMAAHLAEFEQRAQQAITATVKRPNAMQRPTASPGTKRRRPASPRIAKHRTNAAIRSTRPSQARVAEFGETRRP